MIASSDTQSSDHVPEDGEHRRLPVELGGSRSPNRQHGGHTENDDVGPVQLEDEVAPSDIRKGFCFLESVLDIVVGDVKVYGFGILLGVAAFASLSGHRLRGWAFLGEGGGGRRKERGGERQLMSTDDEKRREKLGEGG